MRRWREELVDEFFALFSLKCLRHESTLKQEVSDMKSQHLAKADFLRELQSLTKRLYDLGDFTANDPERRLHEATLNGFIDAGLLLEACSRADMQEVIDQCHLEVFGESRGDRRKRLATELPSESNEGAATDWDQFDSPAFERSKK